MTPRTAITLLGSVVAAPLIALAVSGCGGSGGAAAAPPTNANGTPVTVGLASSSTLGSILVNSQGRTLYLFKADTGSTSTCTGACAAAWPPLTVTGAPSIGSGANAALLGTTRRSDGTTQVTYNGHPLYLFARDSNAGDTNGQGITAFGAAWFAVTPAGSQASGSGGGGGGGY
jgi:predicted lipoprotein with Yx(FWY)xxD motif